MNIIYPDGMNKWEYTAVVNSGDLKQLMAMLNELGREGWQVCERLGEVLLLIRQVVEETPEEEEQRLKREKWANMSTDEMKASLEERVFGRSLDVDEEPGE